MSSENLMIRRKKKRKNTLKRLMMVLSSKECAAEAVVVVVAEAVKPEADVVAMAAMIVTETMKKDVEEAEAAVVEVDAMNSALKANSRGKVMTMSLRPKLQSQKLPQRSRRNKTSWLTTITTQRCDESYQVSVAAASV